ncbi:hypothetical protein SAMN05446037_1004178 [Anaerovirgula multivorans]|uniref:Uncharacterized protein n=1 Tax=Anaerovirgula multivorans TaxID=312168 RepID=A0A239BYR9_9FIRM|nr:hypothetical protein [Anaerovirgula multivorans]SNS12234.1 hypothetical protein SAMN05446037_1004178 [Anaerovirgula multivorans]
MHHLFLEKEMGELINQADKIDHKTLMAYNKMIGNPKKVGEFIKIFQEAIEKGTSSQTICFKIIEKVRAKNFFSFVMDTVKNSTNVIQIQTIFKSTVALPDEVEVVREYIPIIADMMKRNIDTEVIYHGVCLFYRIITKYPELHEELEKINLTLNHDNLQSLLRKFDILDKWETEGHRGKSKPGYFQDKTLFINFAMKFIKFQ